MIDSKDFQEILVEFNKQVNRMAELIDKLDGQIKPKEKSFEGIKMYITASVVPNPGLDKETEEELSEFPLWSWETTLLIPGRPALSQKGATLYETNQKPLICGLYAGLQQCWMHPASKKGLRIIIEDSTLVSLLKSRESLETIPYDDKDLAERFLSIVGFLKMLPGVEIERQ